MKPILLTLMLFLGFTSLSAENNLKPEKYYRDNNIIVIDQGHGRPFLAGRPLYHADRIYVQLTQSAQKALLKSNSVQSTGGKQFGIKSLDNKLRPYNGLKIQNTFKLRNKLPEKVRSRMRSPQSSLPDLSRIYTVVFKGPYDASKAATLISSDPNVEFAERVPMDYPLDVPDDEKYSECQHLPQIKAEEAWNIHKGEDGSQPVIVGICDTGVDWNHEDLTANVWQNLGEDADGDGHVLEYVDSTQTWIFDPGDENGIDDDGNGYVDDFIGWHFMNDLETGEQSNNPKDYWEHGTHVAGISAGVTNNGIGIASISWNVKFLIAATAPPQQGSIFNGYDGIVYLAENGADVINCSWGGGAYSAVNDEAIQYAFSLGAIIVASAGNDNIDIPLYPSTYPNVIGVAAVDSADVKSGYSSYGLPVDISAPGGEYWVDGGILSTTPNNNYKRFQGTSMAGPVVTGVVALLKSYRPNWSNNDIIRQVLGTADPIDTLNDKYKTLLGYGRVNAYRALAETDVTLPDKVNLDLVRVLADDKSGNDNGAFEPGELINIGFVIRNFTPLKRSDHMHFKISSEDENIEIVKADYDGSIEADGFTEVPLELQVRISKKAKSSFAKINLEISSDDLEIEHGSVQEFEIPVSAGGILVWEGSKGSRGYSGKFIRDFLSERGFDVLYTDNFPATLSGFDAVFLSFGCYGNASGYSINTTGFDDWKANTVMDYLKRGGKLYIEGGEAIGWDQQYNDELHSLLGIDSVDDGTEDKLIDTLEGQAGALTEGLQYIGGQMSFRTIDRLYHGEGKEAFYETNYGPVAVQYEGTYGQKVFTFTYPVAELNDHGNPDSRYEMVKRIMDFLGPEMDYTVPDFRFTPKYGHAPLEVKFTESSFTSVPTTKWVWDFNNDLIPDSYEQNPVHTYDKPGVYDVTARISNSIRSHDTSYTVNVFDGQSALLFGNSRAEIAPENAPDIRKAFTIEAWINPRYSSGTIFDKNVIRFSVQGNRKLNILVKTVDGNWANYSTADPILEMNKWQHVAATYDGDSVVNIYVNGKKAPLRTFTVFTTDSIADNADIPVIIGNNSGKYSGFYGRIDELRLWNIERDSADLKSTMYNVLQGDENGLQLYLKFQEGNGPETKIENTSAMAAVYSDWGQGWHPMYIQTDPEDFTGCKGAFATFSVEPSPGFDSIAYKWYEGTKKLEDNEKYEGTHTDVLTIHGLGTKDEGKYHVVVTINPGANPVDITSGEAGLTVIDGINITKDLEPEVDLVPGQKLDLKIDADGEDPVVYEWYKGGTLLDKFTGPELMIENVKTSDEGVYYCRIINNCSMKYSVLSQVNVNVMSVSGRNEDAYAFSVIPNPATGRIRILLPENYTGEIDLKLRDILGNRIADIYNGEYKSNGIEYNLSSLNLSTGVYFIQITGKDGSHVVPLRYVR